MSFQKRWPFKDLMRFPHDIRDDEFWDIVGKSSDLLSSEIKSTEIEKAPLQPPPSVIRPAPRPYQRTAESSSSTARAGDAPAMRGADDRREKRARSIDWGANLIICEAMLNPPPSFPSLRIKS